MNFLVRTLHAIFHSRGDINQEAQLSCMPDHGGVISRLCYSKRVGTIFLLMNQCAAVIVCPGWVATGRGGGMGQAGAANRKRDSKRTALQK